MWDCNGSVTFMIPTVERITSGKSSYARPNLHAFCSVPSSSSFLSGCVLLPYKYLLYKSCDYSAILNERLGLALLTAT